MGYEEFLTKLADLAKALAPLIPIVAGLVEFARIIGLPSDKWAVAASVIFGVLLTVLIQVAIMFPVVEPWLLAVVVGALIGMTTTGLYTIGSRWADKVGKE